MRLIKSIFCKIDHLIIDLICSLLINPVLDTSRYTGLFIAVNESFPFLFHDRCFFLGHGTTQKVTSSKCITCKITHDLHNLFLINDTAISRCKDWFKLWAVICDG